MKHFTYFILLSFIVIFSCSEKVEFSETKYVLHIKEQAFDIDSDEDLSRFVKKLVIKENNTGIRINEASIKEAEDVQGKYKYISAKYLRQGRVISVVVPLEELPGKNMYRYVCTMTCDPKENCQKCKQTIHEQCVSQSCECEEGSGGCKAVTSF